MYWVHSQVSSCCITTEHTKQYLEAHDHNTWRWLGHKEKTTHYNTIPLCMTGLWISVAIQKQSLGLANNENLIKNKQSVQWFPVPTIPCCDFVVKSPKLANAKKTKRNSARLLQPLTI